MMKMNRIHDIDPCDWDVIDTDSSSKPEYSKPPKEPNYNYD
jgi:hypothetical protein